MPKDFEDIDFGLSDEEYRRLFRTLLNHVPDQIYFKDREHRFILLDKATAENSLGTPVEDAIGKTDFDIFPDELAREYYEDEEAVMKSKEPVVNKVEKIEVEGETRWNYTTKVPLLDEEGEVIGIAGINRDFTKRKRLEEKLSFERNLLQYLLDHVPDQIYFKNEENKFVRVSESKAEQLGVEREEVEGKNEADFYPEEQANKMLEKDKKVMEEEEPIINEVEKITTPDGRDRWMSFTRIPRYDDEGNVIGSLGIARDLTEHWVLWRRIKDRVGT